MFDFKNIPGWLSLLSRIVLAAVFLFGGVPKLLTPNAFAVVISAYGILPDLLVFPAAVILPLVEIVTAVGLLFNRRWAMVTAILLLFVFIGVLTYGISLGLHIDCGCFGPEDPERGALSSLDEARFRDVLFLMPAGYIWWFSYVNKEKN